MTFPTTANARALSLAWEGPHKPVAWLDTDANPPVWTVARGLTKIRDNISGQWRNVVPGDKIPDETDGEIEAQAFIDEIIIPELQSVFSGVAIQPGQGDALVSMAYNMGSFAFPKTAQLIRDGASLYQIQAEWVHSNDNWNDLLGLYRRRLTEALVFAGWDMENALSVTARAKWATEISDLMERPALEPDLIIDEPKSRQAVIDATADPTPETPLTTEDLNYQQYVQLGGDDTFEEFTGRVVRETKTVTVPKVDMKTEPEAMEDNETHKRLSKAESGKEYVIIGGAASVATTSLPLARELTGFMSKYDLTEMLFAGLLFAAICAGVGLFRWWYNANKAEDARQKATRAAI